MKTELELKQKIAEIRSQSPEWFLSLSNMDMSPALQAQVTEHLPYIQAGMLIGIAWALGLDENDMVASLFSPEQLERHGLKMDNFDTCD